MEENERLEKYNVRLIARLPAGVFGEAYVIEAVSEISPKVFALESYVLSSKIAGSIYSETYDFGSPSANEEYIKFNLKTALEEVRLLTYRNLSHLMHQRAKDTKQEDIEYMEYKLRKTGIGLYSPKMRGLYIKEMNQILKETACKKLQRYLKATLQKKL